MDCPFCAETIKDAAILCRFCGARLVDGRWIAPERPRAAKGTFTIVSSGYLLLLSSAWSLATIASPVVLFGASREGVVAVLYNAAFAAAFGAMGFALVTRKPWALAATWAASAIYTFDKLAAIFDGASVLPPGDEADALGSLGTMVEQVSRAAAVAFLICWWGFVAFLYLRRAHFARSAEPGGPKA